MLRIFSKFKPVTGSRNGKLNGGHAYPDIENTIQVAKQTFRISIIIPVYKEEKILPHTLSIFTPELRRKYGLQIIISDGGSNDRTVEIARQHTDFVVEHKKARRQTISEGRNKGAEYAEAEILVFINADTIPDNPDEFFEKISNWENTNSEIKGVDAIACYVGPLPGKLTIRDKLFYIIYNRYIWLVNRLGVSIGRGECQVIKKDVFERAGRYNEAYSAGEDFDLYRRIGRIGTVKYNSKLRVLESTRRFKKYGYFRTILSWTLNAMWVWVFGKSFSKEWEAVR